MKNLSNRIIRWLNNAKPNQFDELFSEMEIFRLKKDFLGLSYLVNQFLLLFVLFLLPSDTVYFSVK